MHSFFFFFFTFSIHLIIPISILCIFMRLFSVNIFENRTYPLLVSVIGSIERKPNVRWDVRDVSSQRRRLQMSNNYVYLFIWQARCQDDSILSLGDLITETKTSIYLKSADLHSMDTPPKGDEFYTLRKVSLFTYFREKTIPPRNEKGLQNLANKIIASSLPLSNFFTYVILFKE